MKSGRTEQGIPNTLETVVMEISDIAVRKGTDRTARVQKTTNNKSERIQQNGHITPKDDLA